MSDPTYRELARCMICKAWWSVPEGEIKGPGLRSPCCPCGGHLALVDMKAHLASLPAAPVVSTPAPLPAPDPKPK